MMDADLRAAIVHALEQCGLPATITALRSLSGGCVHQALEVRIEGRQPIVAKVNRGGAAVGLFEEEMAGLAALRATGTVEAPEWYGVVAREDWAVMLMSLVERAVGTEQSWREFGRDLAALHAADAGERYGFHADNHIGATLQPNSWHDDWVQFNAVNRLGWQLEKARDAELLNASEVNRLEAVIGQLDHFIPSRPKPALLHGDLWAGNALPTLKRDHDSESRATAARPPAGHRAAAHEGDITCAVIDPACSIGDGLADIAMMKLFGGFPTACFESYAHAAETDLDSHETRNRIAVYQLYHVLNHVNMFGRGYAGQAVQLARTLADAGDHAQRIA